MRSILPVVLGLFLLSSGAGAQTPDAASPPVVLSGGVDAQGVPIVLTTDNGAIIILGEPPKPAGDE